MTNQADKITFDRAGFYLKVKDQDGYFYYMLGKRYQIEQAEPISFEQLPQKLRWVENF